jgi:hypothetical protein
MSFFLFIISVIPKHAFRREISHFFSRAQTAEGLLGENRASEWQKKNYFPPRVSETA